MDAAPPRIAASGRARRHLPATRAVPAAAGTGTRSGAHPCGSWTASAQGDASGHLAAGGVHGIEVRGYARLGEVGLEAVQGSDVSGLELRLQRTALVIERDHLYGWIGADAATQRIEEGEQGARAATALELGEQLLHARLLGPGGDMAAGHGLAQHLRDLIVEARRLALHA